MTDRHREGSPPGRTDGGGGTRLAVDIGGTFTDLVFASDGDVGVSKTPTRPAAPAKGVVTAVEKSAVDPAAVDRVVHGTTVVINAITERTGAAVALLTTAGFRDVLDVTRANRPDMFNYRYEKPDPFVPRRSRWEVPERIDAAGDVLEPLDEAAVRAAAEAIRERDFGAVAVAYINAYANPAHERRTGEIVREVHPDAYVTLSHEISGRYREYERTNTAVLNAYVRPVVDEYLADLERRLRGAGCDAEYAAMTSNAGTSGFDRARAVPVELVESGPVGGVHGAARLGRAIGEPDVISLDVGGTTAKTSVVEDGSVTIETDYWIERTERFEGYPLSVPVVDIVEIGAGGGSIAWVDDGGSLNVGPRSAGAVPGPACYGRGGSDPTVTDAHLLTGRLDPGYFLGGEMPLDADASRAAIDPVADELGATARETAHGVLRIANSNMGNALKRVSVRRGHDPREFVLVASGGAGGLHAPTLGRELEVKEIVIPRAPGQFSAWGMLQTDPRRDYIRTDVQPFARSNADAIADRFAGMEERVRREVGGDRRVERGADLRYRGQEHTVTTPLPDGPVDGDAIGETVERFHARHDDVYNFSLDDLVEVVHFRVVATVRVPKPSPEAFDGPTADGDPRKGTRAVDFVSAGEREADIYERDGLAAGTSIEGPAIVEEPTSTVLVHPDQRLRVDGLGLLRIDDADRGAGDG